MNIILNGENFSLDTEHSVSDLVQKLQIDLRKVAIERNLEIVPRSQYENTLLEQGDNVEIVAFMGGG